MTQFTHLHVHSHFSLLDGMSQIKDLVSKCQRTGMNAIALTDHGNMFGIKEFVDTTNNVNNKIDGEIKKLQETLIGEISEEEKANIQQQIDNLNKQHVKPIIGIEAYCAHGSRHTKTKDDRGWHLILLAKNKQGYHNLCKMSSYAFMEGYYYNARIDHELLEQYHEGVICSSACLGGEVPRKILNGDIAGAEQSILWFKSIFGEDYYLELQRHKTDKPNAATDTFEKQEIVNKVLIEMARKHNIKLIATNDVHFVEEEHGEAHDRLICVSTGKKYTDPRMHYTKQEWLKTPDEMAAIFQDIPEAIANTQEVADKVESYSINSAPIMPMFDIPESFGSEEEYRSRITEQELFDEFTRNDVGEIVMSQEKAEAKIKNLGGYNKLYRIKFEADYLEKLTYDGAKTRYGDSLTAEQSERIRFELHTIKTMGFPGYFLIVQDYIKTAREKLNVRVGPGRGSASGSVVAYCLRITDIDPLKYNLLFERFLNPDRISLPDIDVDFDDAGRGRVLDWITEKYGVEKVAHIITYGKMATKTAIDDVGRVQDIPLNDIKQIKALIPDKLPDNAKNKDGKLPPVTIANCIKYVPEIRDIMENGRPEIQSLLTYASELENTNRQIGIHACGVIIGADDLTNFAPLCTIKDEGKDITVTQYDGHMVEDVGLIKMDFLGLKNLTIISDALESIKRTTGQDIDIDHIPIDDPLTYQLYCEGRTVATFQFESSGMRQYLRELQPKEFEDLIAMNALYRPGPMDYIPDFIKRKRDPSSITYDIPCMETYLKDTYGITVYQEQVMLLSRQLANFTRGQSDSLRKAMGKKKAEEMSKLEVLFYKGGESNGHPRKILEKIWQDWVKFASYAFNKSHATCYSWVAYQTAYLKAHYPAQYMAAVLTSSLSEIARVTELIKECQSMKLDVLPPNINESDIKFSVNDKGQIRFGLGAIKGMGEAASQAIIDERNANGPFVDIFDFLNRVNMRTINRKNIESLVKSGAMDTLDGMHRAQYFATDVAGNAQSTFLEKLVRWAAKQQENKQRAQISIFDVCEDIKTEAHPPIPMVPKWNTIERCRYEKEAVGFYISGHPLDDYKHEIQYFARTPLSYLKDENLDKMVGTHFSIAGVVAEAVSRQKSDGSTFNILKIESYDDALEIRMFGDDAVKYANYCKPELFLLITGVVEQRKYKDQKSGEIKTLKARIAIHSITELGSVLNKNVKKLRLRLALDDVNDEFVTRLTDIANKCKGEANLAVDVCESSKDLTLHLSAPSIRVSPREFISEMQQFDSNVKIYIDR